MPAAIRIYFEGHKLLKPGFNVFFRKLRALAQEKRCGWQLISAKSGDEAQRDFELALEQHPDSWNILLRDSEGPLSRGGQRGNRRRCHYGARHFSPRQNSQEAQLSAAAPVVEPQADCSGYMPAAMAQCVRQTKRCFASV